MRKILSLIICLFVLQACAFATTGDFSRVVRNGKLIHTTNGSIGVAIAETASAATLATINVTSVPEGNAVAEIFFEVDTYGAAAVSTVSNITGTVEGDKVYIQSTVASQDIAIDESGNIKLGATGRLCSDPQDMIILLNYDGSNLKEIGFFDNN